MDQNNHVEMKKLKDEIEQLQMIQTSIERKLDNHDQRISNISDRINVIKEMLDTLKNKIDESSCEILPSPHVVQVKKPKKFSFWSQSLVFLGGFMVGSIIGYTYSTPFSISSHMKYPQP